MEIITFLVVLLTLVLLFFLLSMIWPPDSPWSPWWRTNSRRARVICKLAKVGEGDIVYDLGSGDGTLLLVSAKEFGAMAKGVEIDTFRVWYSRFKAWITGQDKQVKIVRGNFFDVDVRDATVVFMYLVPKTLSALKPKLIKELKPGTRVLTFVYRIDLPIVQEDLKNEIYLYEIPRK
jgi:predicted RNA methylase